MWEIWANLLLPKALKSCTKYKKSPNLVTLPVRCIKICLKSLQYFCPLGQRTLTFGGRITVQLVSSLTRLELTNEGNIIFLYLVKQSNATL